MLATQRLRAQLLSGPPATSVAGVTDRLLAVQAQDGRGARLAIRARSAGLVAADVDHALTSARSHVVSWLNRGTLHLVAAQDYWWLHPLTTPQLRAGNARRLAQEGVPPSDAERAVAAIRRSLADGPLTRAELAGRVAAANVRTQGQAIVHLLMLATMRGLIVRGPMRGSEQAFVLAADWLGKPPLSRPTREVALGLLARRYLAGHGPASDRDLAKWAGLTLGDARLGLAAIGAGLADRADGLACLPGEPGAYPPVPALRLLGAFDPLLLGWASRQMFLAPNAPVITVNGVFRPFVLLRGQGAAIWRIRGGEVVLDPMGPLDAAEHAALAAETADVARFLAG